MADRMSTTKTSDENCRVSKLFLFGVFLLISNFIVGKIALPLFAIDFYLGLGVYLFSWLMLGAGLLISGKEGWKLAKEWYKSHKNRGIRTVTKRMTK